MAQRPARGGRLRGGHLGGGLHSPPPDILRGRHSILPEPRAPGPAAVGAGRGVSLPAPIEALWAARSRRNLSDFCRFLASTSSTEGTTTSISPWPQSRAWQASRAPMTLATLPRWVISSGLSGVKCSCPETTVRRQSPQDARPPQEVEIGNFASCNTSSRSAPSAPSKTRSPPEIRTFAIGLPLRCNPSTAPALPRRVSRESPSV